MTDWQPGDIAAFSGQALLSKTIEFFSGALSHVAIVIPKEMLVDGKPQTEPHIWESTREAGHSGPQINPLSKTWATYPGGSRLYRFQLSDRYRAFLDWTTLWDVAVRKLHGDSYNVLELGAYVLRKLPVVSYIPQLYEANSHEEVCSEAIAELLRAGGMAALNPPLISPSILATYRIYKCMEQVAGPVGSIRAFNTV